MRPALLDSSVAAYFEAAAPPICLVSARVYRSSHDQPLRATQPLSGENGVRLIDTPLVSHRSLRRRNAHRKKASRKQHWRKSSPRLIEMHLRDGLVLIRKFGGCPRAPYRYAYVRVRGIVNPLVNKMSFGIQPDSEL